MVVSTTLLTGLAAPLFELIDDLFTSDEERSEAKRKLLSQEGKRSLQQLEINMSAIVAEAKSADPWTSRARPSFLYVIYLMILGAIPMGFLSAFEPEIAQRVVDGMQGWLAAIPEALWGLFGAGYLGYSGFRSWDKKKIGS
jgi:Holin of 3TMs, for gene-transfer release